MFGNLFIELLAMLGSLIVAALIVFVLAVMAIFFGACVKTIKAGFKAKKKLENKKEENDDGQ